MDLPACHQRQAATILRSCFSEPPRFPAVVHLHIGPLHGTFTEWQALLHTIALPCLRSLHVRYKGGAHEEPPFNFTHFSSLTSITALQLSQGSQPFGGPYSWWGYGIPYSNLEAFPTIIDLCLDNCAEADHHLWPHLTGLTRLRSLSLRNTEVAAGQCPIPHLPTFYNLTCLNLSYTGTSNLDIAPLTALQHLQRLLLENTHLCSQSDDVVDIDNTLAKLVSLTCLNLRGTHCAQGAHHLSALTRLQRLHLGGNTSDERSSWIGVNDTGLQALTTLTQLTRLQVPANGGITRQGLQAIATFAALQELDISWSTRCTDSDLLCLGSLTALRVLAVDNWPVTLDSGFHKVLHIPTLSCVSLRNCTLTVRVAQLLCNRQDMHVRSQSSGPNRFSLIEIGHPVFPRHYCSGNVVLHSFRARTSFTDW